MREGQRKGSFGMGHSRSIIVLNCENELTRMRVPGRKAGLIPDEYKKLGENREISGSPPDISLYLSRNNSIGYLNDQESLDREVIIPVALNFRCV